jgi:hypothetical protein
MRAFLVSNCDVFKLSMEIFPSLYKTVGVAVARVRDNIVLLLCIYVTQLDLII